jgi:hypothetical protein
LENILLFIEIIIFVIVVSTVIIYGLNINNIPTAKRVPEILVAALVCAVFCGLMDNIISMSYTYAAAFWLVIFAIVFTVNKYRSEKQNTKFSIMLALWATAGILIYAFCLLFGYYFIMSYFLKLISDDGGFLANILLSSTFSLVVNFVAFVIFCIFVTGKKIIKFIKK